ncbi:MAG TPA: cytochrome c biogenesis protein CcdA [Spirochaetota bacterium]|nr:cytochrome c biogenesis protein CcdA [Spirochaetota bacterium]HPC42342.1 cytochrome c biogenesis protein CcdA [Spirochaetota bacterium]HPL17844.1 cytochrome c biogenesis protein CcdA [Spirochaetota bacterium]HQF10209.1 cytochrome c biogenesis protein CcdA [Spirochaetota bacterium]HQH99355.1 cytochrome c biogenesis protein CcdA [Spirochaetota bacterium]
MILELFTWLSGTLTNSAGVALGGAFIWGVLSILLSPCHLASIPLIVGFIDEQGRISTKRAFSLALLFSTGILITIGLIGLITGLLGRMLGDIGKWGNYFVAVIFIVVGLHLLGVIPLPFLEKGANASSFKRKGLLAAFILGLIFGVALGPCTFAYMAPMLGVVFNVASTRLLFAVSLILAYAVGHCSVIVFAGTFTEVVQRYLNWNENSKGAVILKKVCGVLVIAGGLYLIFSA